MLLCVLVTGCGGGGGGSSSPPALGSIASKLFVADAGNSSIASTVDADPPSGTLAFDRVIDGAATGISNNVRSLAIDPSRGLLYVANGGEILVFSNPGTADGNVSPARTIDSADFGNIIALYLDTTNDVLYAGDSAQGVWMIHAASTRDGTLTPDRRLTGNFGAVSFQIHDIFVDTTRNLLYVSRTTSASEVLVFGNASSVNGTNITAARTITPSPSMGVRTIFADVGRDELYAANVGSSTIVVFAAASSADGSTPADRIVNWGSSTVDFVVDTAHDRLYAIDSLNMFILYDAHLLTGTVTPTKTLSVPGGTVVSAIAVNP